jgi:hypothetical protein
MSFRLGIAIIHAVYHSTSRYGINCGPEPMHDNPLTRLAREAGINYSILV